MGIGGRRRAGGLGLGLGHGRRRGCIGANQLHLCRPFQRRQARDRRCVEQLFVSINRTRKTSDCTSVRCNANMMYSVVEKQPAVEGIRQGVLYMGIPTTSSQAGIDRKSEWGFRGTGSAQDICAEAVKEEAKTRRCGVDLLQSMYLLTFPSGSVGEKEPGTWTSGLGKAWCLCVAGRGRYVSEAWGVLKSDEKLKMSATTTTTTTTKTTTTPGQSHKGFGVQPQRQVDKAVLCEAGKTLAAAANGVRRIAVPGVAECSAAEKEEGIVGRRCGCRACR